MGLVYLGFDRHLGRQVAIKTLTEGFMQDPEMLRRFYREAAKTGALKHPNIVIVYDLGEQDGFPYIVMEYVPGEPLDKIIRSNRPMPLVSKLKIIEQVCLALGYAHRNDVVHRDVKPANVIVQDEDAKLLDFGIAHHEMDREHRLTKAGSVIGTLHYMAPERLRGAPFDGRSDLFSAGAMLYELLTGQLPFSGHDAAVAHQILNDPSPFLSKYTAEYPPALDAIIQRALAKNPDDRHGTGEEMAAEIAALSERLRKEQGAEMFRRAEQLVHAEDFLRARDLLAQLIKLDSKNIDARKLMASVQSNLAVRQRSEQVQQLQLRAEDALQEKLYEEAISRLEQALKLDPTNAGSLQKLDLARQRKHTQDQIEAYLRKADGAREVGEFQFAQSLLQKAMDLDAGDSRIKVAWSTLAAQIEADAQQRKVIQILESAQSEMQARRFTAALQILEEAAQNYPGNADVVRLLQSAKTGREYEQRRKIVEQIQSEVSLALTVPQIAAASQTVEKALQQMPTEASLLKFKGQLDRQLKDLLVRTRVDETVQRCYPLMENSPQEALALVQEQLRALPAEERLLILQSAIEERLAHLKLEETRSHFMARAHEAIRSQRYWEAVQVLEACHSEGIFSDEITDLLEFARHEARREERSAAVETALAKARALIAQGSYDQAIALLEPALAQMDDPSLRVLLEKARSERHSEQLRLRSVLTAQKQLASSQQWDEALSFLEQQPAAVRETDAVRSALGELHAAQDCETRILQAAGEVYVALHRADLARASESIKSVRSEQGLSELAAKLADRLDIRLSQMADRVVSEAISGARSALQAHDPDHALQILASCSVSKDFSTLEIKQDWQKLRKQAGRAKLLGRFGIRGNPSGTAPN